MRQLENINAYKFRKLDIILEERRRVHMRKKVYTQNTDKLLESGYFLAQKLYSPIQSSTAIEQMRKKTKIWEKQHSNMKKHLQMQLKSTGFRLKCKKFHKQQGPFRNQLQKLDEHQPRNRTLLGSLFKKINSINAMGYQSKSIIKGTESGNQAFRQKQQKEKNSWERKKTFGNQYLKKKMKLFGNSITDRNKASIENQINCEIIKIEENLAKDLLKSKLKAVKRKIYQVEEEKEENIIENPPNPIIQSSGKLFEKQNKPQIELKSDQLKAKVQEIQKYTICHRILDHYFSLVVTNPKLISLRQHQCQIYRQLKQEMVNLMIKNDQILMGIKFLQCLEGQRKELFNFSRNKLKELKMGRKPFFQFHQQKTDQKVQQINEAFAILSQLIEKAFSELNKPKMISFVGENLIRKMHDSQSMEQKIIERENKTQNCPRKVFRYNDKKQ